MGYGIDMCEQAAESRVVHAKESAEAAKLPTPEARIFP